MKKVIVNISDEDELILLNDLLDIDEWIQQAVKGKINNCKKRMIEPYKSPLVNKTDDELVAYITSQPGYKNRAARDAENIQLTRE